MLTEEKEDSYWSVLMSSQIITLLLYPVISSRGDLVLGSLIQTCSPIFKIKIDDVKI